MNGKPTHHPVGAWLEAFSSVVTRWSGSTWGFATAFLVVIVWAAVGPRFHYSDTWQLVINTGTTIVTFLMVFLIQRSQNKDAMAMQLKLNEIVAALEGASNRMVDIEDLSEDELRALRRYYGKLTRMARADERLTESHSIEEAERQHERKSRKRTPDQGTRTRS